MHPYRLIVPPRDVTADPRRPAPRPAGADPAGPDTPVAGGQIPTHAAPAPDAHGPGGLPVRRTLPERRLAAIGAWCLLEHFGDPASRAAGWETLAYPEAGLLSLTLPIDGLIRRRDGLGRDDLVRPGGVWLGSAGSGVAVCENGVDDPRGGRHARRFLHGVRLAAALPAAHRAGAPTLQAVLDPPTVHTPTMRASVLVGALAGPHAALASPASTPTPLLAADLTLTTTTERLALDPAYEHGVLLLDGELSVDGTPLRVGDLAYLPPGRDLVEFATLPGARVLLVGGEPFEEEFLLWWNIVVASHEEVVAAREAWELSRAPFADLPEGATRAAAPPIPPVRLRPRRGSVRPRT